MKTLILFFLFLLVFLYCPFHAIHAKCTDTRPGSAPILQTAVASNSTVTLSWQEAADPVSYYLLAYGTSETSFEYGVPNIGGKGTNTYTIEGLQTGTKYYFKVRAGNGCKPGSFSNKLSSIPGEVEKKGYIAKPPKASFNYQILGATDSSELKIASIQEDSDVETLGADESISDICIDCSGWKLLLIEIVILCLYFFLTKKLQSKLLKPIYSILIPIIIYLYFRGISNDCPLEEFFCKYFLFLNFFIFLIIMVIFRQFYIKSHDKK